MADDITPDEDAVRTEFAYALPKSQEHPVTAVNRAETGQPGNIGRSSWFDPIYGPAQWESVPDEPNIDLQFPYSIPVYDAMARTDPQIGSLHRAITLALRRAKWTLNTGEEPVPPPPPPVPPPPSLAPASTPGGIMPPDPVSTPHRPDVSMPSSKPPPKEGFSAFAGPGTPPAQQAGQKPLDVPQVPMVTIPSPPIHKVPARRKHAQLGAVVRPEVDDFVRSEIGLARPGDNLPDSRTSTVLFRQHLQESLRALIFGFSIFEQVYQVEIKDGKKIVHLWKLASRPQKTILHFLIEPDGDLKAIVQKPLPLNSPTLTGIVLPAETLVVYSHEREGADWSGTSILRNCYKNWLIKDTVLRIGAQVIERNGMGIPDVTYTEGGDTSKAEALAIATALRAGSAAGIAHSSNVSVQILGVTGTIVPTVPFLTYNDQQIAGSALAMFMTLGHDHGARSLGDTFLDVFTNSLQAEADNFAEEFTRQVIKPLVAANFGPDEPYPVLDCGNISETGVLDARSMNQLVAAGLITPDATLEAFLRTKWDLPDADEPAEAGSATDGPPYDGVDPNSPWVSRVNQPNTQGIAGIPPRTQGKTRPTLTLIPPSQAGGGFSGAPGRTTVGYQQWLVDRRAALMAELALTE